MKLDLDQLDGLDLNIPDFTRSIGLVNCKKLVLGFIQDSKAVGRRSIMQFAIRHIEQVKVKPFLFTWPPMLRMHP